MSAIAELFQDKSYCYDEIKRIRETFGNKTTTRRQYQSLMGTCYMMLLHCPKEIYDLVLGLNFEAHDRELHFALNIWPYQENK